MLTLLPGKTRSKSRFHCSLIETNSLKPDVLHQKRSTNLIRDTPTPRPTKMFNQ